MKTSIIVFLILTVGFLVGVKAMIWHVISCCQCRRRLTEHWDHLHNNGFVCERAPHHLHHHRLQPK